MGDESDDIRMVAGPQDGAEFDRDLFGGPLPAGLSIMAAGRLARYELDIDAAGPLYRFAGWSSPAPARPESEALRRRADRARESAWALAAEARALIGRSRAERASRRDAGGDLWDPGRLAKR